MFPPGYNSKEATRRLAQTNFGVNAAGVQAFGDGKDDSPEVVAALKNHIYGGYPDVLKDMVMIAGTPDNVIPKFKKVIDILRPGIFSFWLDGPVPFKDRQRCLQLLNSDVIPALRDYGKKLGLVSPFQRTPGSVPLKGGKPEPVSNPAALAELAA